jgi:hypothetical protein
MLKEQEVFEFKVDESSGRIIGHDDCHYDSKAEAMYFGQLELCGCGNPDDVHRLIIECSKMFEGDKKKGIDGIMELVKSEPKVASEFIAHFLEQKNLTEHGGSVYGSWLTDRGKQFIEIGPMET